MTIETTQPENAAESAGSDSKRLVRPGDLHSMEMMDCPVFLLQEQVTKYNDNNEPVQFWKTVEGVWFTRTEAEAWAQAHHYRMGEWRAYGVGARGQLKTLLKSHTDYSA